MADQLLQPQEADPLNVSEATVAVIGLTPVLKGEMPFIGVMKQREILDLPRWIQSLAQDMVNDRLPRKLKLPRDWKYMQLLERFTNPLSEQEITTILARFAPNLSDQAIAFVHFISEIHKYLADMLPVQVYDTVLGPEPIEPTGDKLYEFWNRYLIVNDPLIVFTLAQSGALLPEQVATLVEFYPSLYEQIKSALVEALTKRKLVERKFLNLPPRTDMGCTVLLQKRLVEFNSNLHVVTPDPIQAQAGAVTSSSPSKTLESPAQKASQP